MKIVQTKTPEEFTKITIPEFFDLWWAKAMTQGQIAKYYGVTRKEVVAKRKELGLTNIKCAFMAQAGGDRYKKMANKKNK